MEHKTPNELGVEKSIITTDKGMDFKFKSEVAGTDGSMMDFEFQFQFIGNGTFEVKSCQLSKKPERVVIDEKDLPY